MTDFTLPELGENVASGDVLRILVKPGDTITKDQAVLELETDKATIEVPSSVAGQVKEVRVKAGDKVTVGQVILSVEAGAAPESVPRQRKAEAGEARRPRRLTLWQSRKNSGRPGQAGEASKSAQKAAEFVGMKERSRPAQPSRCTSPGSSAGARAAGQGRRHQ